MVPLYKLVISLVAFSSNNIKTRLGQPSYMAGVFKARGAKCGQVDTEVVSIGVYNMNSWIWNVTLHKKMSEYSHVSAR